MVLDVLKTGQSLYVAYIGFIYYITIMIACSGERSATKTGLIT